MGGFLLVLLLFVFSCGPKVSTLEEYERKNPYPSTEDRLEYASRGSLMPKNGFQDLYSERRASRVGDVIFVQVSESINAIESVASQTQRSSSFKQGISSLFGISTKTLEDIGGQGSGQMDMKGSGKVQQTGVLTTKLAGRVMRTYPNGTMLIEAKKSMVVNRSQRDVILRGIVRPEDIDSTNTITSDRIANLEVFIDGKGFLVDGSSPGWLARILAKVLPF
ncbi:MAG: flagellar basal body L-ring protein FlgH [Aquificaceae bacterium]|nr:flagellar basal body L-ring protein FlgH [Aquificaceae bacterium]MDW8422848.1 flagellar basal body L-ring protein FlgH [Aquificaceae bacterium]